MSGQFAIKTPFKLKRDAPNTLSTLDRTIPALKSAHPPPPPKPIVKVPLPTDHLPAITRHTLPADTAQLQREMDRLMGRDEQLSKRSSVHTKSGHSYTVHPLQSRLVLSLPHPIPSRVQHLHDQQTAQEKAPCSFKQGVLAAACVYYFAVGRWVLFYDIGRTVQLGGKLEEAFMHQCQFQSAVVEVRELSIKHPIFGEFKNRALILVAMPWKLGFAALELQGGDRLQTGPRWMRLTTLNTSLTIAAQQPSHFTQDPTEHRLYYLDQEGGINCVAFQSNNWLGKLMGNNSRYRLSQATAPSGINSKAFFTSRRATIWERLRHYSKVILAQATSFYGRINKNCDLVCDGRRRLLFSLVDTNYDPVDAKPSPYRLLTAWDTSQEKLTVMCQISEAELYQREIAGIANFPALSNYRIVRLSALSACIDPQVQLMVLLQCGIRLYLSVKKCFRLVRHHLPPLLEGHSVYGRQPMEHSRTVQLTHCHVEGSSAIMNLKQEGDNHTFIIWRLNQEKQEEECAEVIWGSSMSSPSGNAPLENQLHRVQLSLAPQKKKQILKELASSYYESSFSGAKSLPLHQLARDLLLPPSPYIHSTDADIEWLCEVRPIDWAFSAVQANMRDQRIFKRVLEGLPQEELIFLLVQLFCDPEGLYLKDLQLIDCLAHYERRVLQQGGTQFDAFHHEFRSRTQRATSSRKQQREIQPTYVGRDSIDAQMEGRLLDLLLRLAKHTDGNPKREIQVQQTIVHAITLYLSRLLRFLWRIRIKNANLKLQGLLAMIHPITRIIQHCRTPPTKPKTLPQQPQYKLETLVPTRKSKEVAGPNIHEAEPLQAAGRLVGRITQLLSLCSKVDLWVEKTFAEALAMTSQQFEAPLFYFLTDKYEYPTAALQVFRQAFPSFVGEQLERSLRIEQESRGKTESEVVAILRYHKGVPTYLLRHLQGTGKIHPDSSRDIQSLSRVGPASKLSLSSCNVREGVATLLRELREAQATLQQRALTVVQLKALLAHHLQTHQQEDRFYRDSRSELQEVERRLTMQQLLISQYEHRGEANVQVASELKTSLFQQEILKELVDLLKVPRLKIIFILMFVRQEEDQTQRGLEEQFSEIIDMDRRGNERREEGLLKKAHSFIQDKLQLKRSQSPRWAHLQHTIDSIIANTRSSLPLEHLLPILTRALLGHCAASPNISSQLIDDTLPALAQILGGSDRFEMRQQVHRLSLPVLSAMLRKAGCEQTDLQSYYQASLRTDSQGGAIKDAKEALYQWIGLACLSLEVQPRGEFFLFNSKRFFDNLTTNSPEKRVLMPHLRLLCKNYAILHRLETLHSELFPQ